jgi:DNA-binding response OmpR family regulator
MLHAKILLLDDDPAYCRFLEHILTHEGAQVITASNVQEALRLHDQEQPDLVILDVVLDGIDGFDVCCQLRRRSDVLIIMLTGVDQTDYMVKGLACGADDYIVKSIDLIVLLARIRAKLRWSDRYMAGPAVPRRVDAHQAGPRSQPKQHAVAGYFQRNFGSASQGG